MVELFDVDRAKLNARLLGMQIKASEAQEKAGEVQEGKVEVQSKLCNQQKGHVCFGRRDHKLLNSQKFLLL